MKPKLLLAVMALVVSPGLAFAGCSSGHLKEEIVMSCADGLVYDPETQTCVSLSTS